MERSFYDNSTPYQRGHWGHSKGIAAWNDDREGFVLQVSTPSRPASGSKDHPRQNDGNTLGCINDDIEVSQHFFALKLTKNDLVAVLSVLANASVLTDIKHPKIIQNGGHANVQTLVNKLGLKKKSRSKRCIVATSSSGVQLISKPSRWPRQRGSWNRPN